MAFVYPNVLWGLFLVLVPIVIHLFQFRRYRIQYFSNTAFLTTLKKQTHRQSQIKKLIILSLRILAIICLVVSFAKPYIPKKNTNTHFRQNIVCIYIDNSFSMSNESQNGNLLNEAKTQAKALVDAFGETDMFMLLTNDMEIKHQRTFAKQEIKKEIDDIAITPVSKTLSEIYAYMRQNMGFDGRHGSLYLFSDFQTTMSDFGQIKQDSLLEAVLVPLKTNKINNLSVDSTWILSPNLIAGQNIDIYFSVSNQSDKDMEKVPVKLFLNNQQKALTSLDIKANTSVTGRLNVTLDSKQWQTGSIKIMDYPINFDDQLFFSLNVKEKMNVLHCYNGKNNKYIEQLFAYDSGVVFSTNDIRSVNYHDFSKQQLLIVDVSNDISDGFVHEIEQYVNNGGNLLLLPVNETYNNKINQYLNITTLGKLITTPTKFDKLNVHHLLFENVFEAYPENIDLPNVTTYFELNKSIGKNKETLIALENNADYLTVEQYGNGFVFVLASPLSEEYSDFMKHAIFVPTIYNMMVVSNKEISLYYTIGKDELITLNNTVVNDDVLELTNNKQTFIPEVVRYNRNKMQLKVHENVKQSGVFVLHNKRDTLNMLAFNFNRNESVMQFLSQRDLSENIDKYNFTAFSLLNIQHKNIQQIQNQIMTDQHKNLYYLFLILGLIFLLLEGILLRIFGGQKEVNPTK